MNAMRFLTAIGFLLHVLIGVGAQEPKFRAGAFAQDITRG